MIRALWTSASGMIAQQLNLDVTANNLANVNTTGFKKNRAEFEDLMYQNMKIAGATTQDGNQLPVGMQVGMGVRPVSVHNLEALLQPRSVALFGADRAPRRGQLPVAAVFFEDNPLPADESRPPEARLMTAVVGLPPAGDTK